MDGSGKPSEKLSPLKQAFLALEDAEARLAAIERERNEPIAVIGMGCRFPGRAVAPQAFWNNLCEGRNSVSVVPRDRWDIDAYYDPDPEAPGKMSTRWGAFIEDVDRFDAEFFGIPPREARSMDPQQRILMEVVWQALEDAGHASLPGLEGSATGVFVGITTDDYAQLMMEARGLKGIDTYFASGNARSIASGRISYQLGLVGPAVSLDTACSSSLLAVHQACRSLLDRECRMAIAAGVNLILSPANTVALSKYQMMAPDGRCKVFDAAADGFVRGEGCGAVVLKRLSEARADRDRIYALILGTAANQDGPSSGLTAPNGPSQEAVMQAALKRAGVKPDRVGYVEAHGTGTALGDPIEVRALGECYCKARSADRPLVIGSVKTNIGHLEAAAGIAGLIKTVLVLHHGEIPPNLHWGTPNPEIPWDRYALTVPTRRMTLANEGKRALAAVTALGFSGTNVHAVLSSASERPAARASIERPLHVFPLSARSPEALRRQAEGLRRWAESAPPGDIADAAYTLGPGRTHHSHRLALVAGCPEDLKRELDAYLNGRPTAVRSGSVADPHDPPRVAFLFTGQGSQYAGMGAGLERHHPHFRACVDECDAVLQPLLGRSVREIIFPTSENSSELIHQTALTQPALFTLEYALARLWLSWGIRPDCVLGHSLGEYVAACISGVLTLEDALNMVVQRSRLMQSVSVPGGMATVMAGEEEVARRLAPYGESLAIAAVNGPKHVVISGAAGKLDLVSAAFQRDGVAVIPLRVSHAFHSPLLEPVLDQFEKAIAGIRFHAPGLRLVSNVSGSVVSREGVGHPGYWRRHAREAVRFMDGMRTLADQGCRIFIEIGPRPVLLSMGRQCLDGGGFAWLPSLDGKTDDWSRILGSLADAYAAGAEVDWGGFDKPYERRRLSLPTYPFQGRRFWFSQAPAISAAPSPLADGAHAHSGHLLLGTRVDSATGRIQFRSRIGGERTSFFKEHRVAGAASLPMAAVIEAALAAGRLLWPGCAVAVKQLSMDRAVRLPDDAGLDLEWVLEPRPEGGYEFQLFSRAEEPSSEGQWQQHATGAVRPTEDCEARLTGALPPETVDAIRRRCSKKTDAAAFYAYFCRVGLDFGPAFRTLDTLWSGRREALGRLHSPRSSADGGIGFVLSPLALDGALQVIAAALMEGEFGDHERVGLHLPVGVDHAMLAHFNGEAAWAHAALREEAGTASHSVLCDVRLLDAESREVAVLSGCRLVPVDADAFKDRGHLPEERLLYQIRWRPRPDSGTDAARPADSSQFVFPLQDLPATLDAKLPELARAERFAQYESARAEMDALVALYIMRALEQLGWRPAAGESVQCDRLAAKLNVAVRHRQLLRRFLDILAEDGFLQPAGEGWKAVRNFAEGDPSRRARELLARNSSGAAELDLIVRCGDRLAEALKGTADPLDLLYRGAAFDSVIRLYSESVTARVFNGMVKQALAEGLQGWPSGRRLHVLEIGAGTGGTARYALEALDGRDASYLFTDISPAFVQAARERFQHLPGFRSRVLDIEKDPATQGLSGERFDLVIAANVLHATSDLADTLRRVHTLTAPGGLLVLLEVTAPQRWVDITFGLTEGWWKFTDRERRRDYPLLSAGEWKTLLAETGFPEALSIPDPARPALFPGLNLQALIAARRGPADRFRPERYEAGASEPPNWMVLADKDGWGPRFCERLQAGNIRTSLVVRGQGFPAEQAEARVLTFDEREDFEILFRRPSGSEEATAALIHQKIVVLWGVDLPPEVPDEAGEPLVRQKALLSPVLHLLQALTESGLKQFPQLIFVTRAAQAVRQFEPLNPHGAALWGMVRAVMIEHPELRCKLIDVDAAAAEDRIGPLLAECAAADGENQVAIRGDDRYVPRLEAMRKENEGPPSDEAFFDRLDITERGDFGNLYWRKAAGRSPEPDQVAIKVAAAGLNFRDVLNALGTYAGGPVPFGGECAGTVAGAGDAAADLKPGEWVLAIAAHCFGAEVLADRRLVWRIPDGLTFEQAAGLPIAYTTAGYALEHLARLRAGQRVLIHAAAGGVGLAAVHLARRAGARIFATAGSPEKRAYLKRLGIPHVMNSRTLEFADALMAATGGEGADVVLNSLAGDFIERSLAVTAKGGVFLELGRSGAWTPEEVKRRRPDVAYHAIDLTEDMAQRPETVRPLFDAVLDRMAAGLLPVLPSRVFSKNATIDAFRYMARARHIGKVVVSWPRSPRAGRDAFPVRADGTYWVTGGLGALGLFTAEWLAARGAGRIVLTGRNVPTPAAEMKLDRLRQKGTGVTVLTADVSRRNDVDRVLETIRKECPPLRGIFHAAGVLDDGVLRHQNWDRFETVMQPKIAGAWNLHQATRHLSLDCLVLYSSVAGLLGSPGQANHCAANAFMDGLAHMRRAAGLPCLSINWGAWAGAGAAVAEEASSRAALKGVGQFSPEAGLRLMENLLRNDRTQAAAVAVDWRKYIQHTHADGPPAPLLNELAARDLPRSIAPAARKAEPPALVTRLRSAPANQRVKLLNDCVHREALRILGLDPSEALDPEKPLHDLGLDSLMAVELRNALGRAAERTLPATLLFDYPSIRSVADYLACELNIDPARPLSRSTSGPGEPESTEDLLRRIEAMQDDDIERLYSKKAQDKN